MRVQSGGERVWQRWWAGLALALGLLAWWALGSDDERPPLLGEADFSSAPSAAASASATGAPQGVNDPWALLRRAEAAEPVSAELQKAHEWLEPKNDAAWCAHAAAQAAKSDQTGEDAGGDFVDELALELAHREALQRWILVLRQRGDARSLAGADYLQAVESRGQALHLRSDSLQQRAASSQDGRVLALAAQLSCEDLQQPGCAVLLSRWLQLEPRNEAALNWQLRQLPQGSPEQLPLLSRLADAQADAESPRTWAALFQSLPRTAKAGLRQEGELSALISAHWAGSGPMPSSWHLVCLKDNRPAAVAACGKLAERIWQRPGGNLMEKTLAVSVGKRLPGPGQEWPGREQFVKLVIAAGTGLRQETSAGSMTCTSLAARQDFQQRLALDGEWLMFSQAAAQPVLLSPAAIPSMDQ